MRPEVTAVLIGVALVLSVPPSPVVDEPIGRASVVSLGWTNVTPSVSPPAMAGAAMAYSSRDNRFVLFGGWNGTTFGDTWVLDPTRPTWNELSTHGRPPPRGDAAFTYDAREDVFVLFGGWYDSPPEVYHRLEDTWHFSLSNTTWTQIPAPTAPSPRSDSAIAYDSLDGHLVLFGGFDGSGYLGDTWRYDTQTRRWENVTSGVEPPPRADGRMAFEPRHNRMVLFGGNDFSGPGFTFHHLNDTWVYSPRINNWTQLIADEHPSSRDYAVFAYDNATGELLLHGGYGERIILGDLWALDVGTDKWTELRAPNGPEPRFAGVGGYSLGDDVFVVFGGLGNNGLFSDTWFFRHPGSQTDAIPGSPPEILFIAFAIAGAMGSVMTAIIVVIRRWRRHAVTMDPIEGRRIRDGQ